MEIIPGNLLRHVPLRQCKICGKRREKRFLIRLFRNEKGIYRVQRDISSSFGRGLYFCKDISCLEKLASNGVVKKKLLNCIDPESLELIYACIDDLKKNLGGF